MMKRILILSLLFLLAAPLLFADEGEAYHGSNFLKIRPGARANGIGLAYLGFSDDSSTLFWNPAGIVTLEGNSFSAGTAVSSSLNDLMGYAGWIFKGKSYGMGIGALATQYPEIEGYDSSGNKTENISNIQGYGILDFSFYLTDYSSMGLGFKGGYQQIDGNSIYVMAGNLGLMMQFLYFQFVLNLEDMGFSWQNEDQKYQYLNPEFSFGISYTKTSQEDERVFGVSLVASRGLDLSNDEARIGIGSFMRIWSESPQVEDFFSDKKRSHNAFFLNLGLENYHGISFSGGASILLFGIKLDYALVFPSQSKKEFTHHASLEIQF